MVSEAVANRQINRCEIHTRVPPGFAISIFAYNNCYVISPLIKGHSWWVHQMCILWDKSCGKMNRRRAINQPDMDTVSAGTRAFPLEQRAGRSLLAPCGALSCYIVALFKSVT